MWDFWNLIQKKTQNQNDKKKHGEATFRLQIWRSVLKSLKKHYTVILLIVDRHTHTHTYTRLCCYCCKDPTIQFSSLLHHLATNCSVFHAESYKKKEKSLFVYKDPAALNSCKRLIKGYTNVSTQSIRLTPRVQVCFEAGFLFFFSNKDKRLKCAAMGPVMSADVRQLWKETPQWLFCPTKSIFKLAMFNSTSATLISHVARECERQRQMY